MRHNLLFFTMITLMCAFSLRAEVQDTTLEQLTAELNAALENDGEITLRNGESFTDPAGSVFFISREAGARILVQMARDGDLELGMMYLPEWGAWITYSAERERYQLTVEPLYLDAALESLRFIEIWHTHTSDSMMVGCGSEETRAREFAIPGPEDPVQMYLLLYDQPYAHLRGVVAGTLGITSYEPDPHLPADWAVPRYIRFALGSEVEQLRMEAGKVSTEKLPHLIRSHVGILRFTFEFVP